MSAESAKSAARTEALARKALVRAEESAAGFSGPCGSALREADSCGASARSAFDVPVGFDELPAGGADSGTLGSDELAADFSAAVPVAAWAGPAGPRSEAAASNAASATAPLRPR